MLTNSCALLTQACHCSYGGKPRLGGCSTRAALAWKTQSQPIKPQIQLSSQQWQEKKHFSFNDSIKEAFL
jgi:hypothetical protein